ncbi:MAG: hypothetical protein ACYCPR_02520 [Thermoplasmataceae archaeon]
MVKGKDYPYLVRNYISCVKLISTYKSKGKLELENKDWLTPSEILLLRETITEAKQNQSYDPPKNEKVRGYLDYITSEKDNGISEGSSYIPFSRVDNSNANSIASKITGMIGKKLNEKSLQALKYSIDELLANVIEHSQYKNSFIMLQDYPSKKSLEFSLMDDGVSIPGNFRAHGISFDNDCDSLKKAINGVSTKDTNGERGFGLHSVFQLLTNGMQGEGVLISGRGILSKEFNEKSGNETKLFCYASDSDEATVFKGCYVAFNIKTNMSPDLYKYLEY